MLQKRVFLLEFAQNPIKHPVGRRSRYAGSCTKSETLQCLDDMLNDGFLKVFSNLDKYEDSGSFEAWILYSIY